METEMIILVCSILGFLTLGCIIAISACLCLVSRKSSRENRNNLTVRSSVSNSYIHYNSPRFSKHNKRRTSTTSGLTQSTASFGVTERIDDCIELGSGRKEVKQPDPVKIEPAKSDLNSNDSREVNLNSLNANISTNVTVTEVGDTTRDTTNATLKSLHATTTSLCEQCLTPSSPPPQPTNTETGGTSSSLPATMVEVAKVALGMTNPASDLPVVCDSCLSPSKLGETAKSLNLPNIKLIDASQSKVQPSGIKTNPRMKNPLLNTLRDTMFEFSALPNINERINENESFDSVLSPSKACDWLSGETFEYSSEDESQYDDPRMIKIKPQIKTKSTRSHSEGHHQHHDCREKKMESLRIKERVLSCREEKSESALEIGFPLHSVSVKQDISNSGQGSAKVFRVSSSKFPFPSEGFPIVAPPSPFRTALKNSTNNLIREVAGQVSRTSLNLNPKDGEQQDSPLSNMVWDSTFEAIKTLENSMRLKLTPQCERVVGKIIGERQTAASHEESDNSNSAETPNKSDDSNLSLAWDNTGHFLESKIKMEEDEGEGDDREESQSSVDIEEIIHRVAPNLSRCDFSPSRDEKQSRGVPSYLRRRTSYSGIERLSEVVSTPLLHQTVYLSVANLNSEDEDEDEDESELKNTLRYTSSSQLHSSPNCLTEQTKRSNTTDLPSPIQFVSASSLLAVPGVSSLPSSPRSFQTDEYMSTCSSLDSYKTIIFDNIADYV